MFDYVQSFPLALYENHRFVSQGDPVSLNYPLTLVSYIFVSLVVGEFL